MAVQRLYQGQKCHIKAQHLVFGVVGDPGHLIRMQARVEGVQDAARAAHTKVKLQVAVTVPGQRGDAGALRQLLRIQCVGYLARTAGHLGPITAVNITFDPTRNDLAVAMVLFGKFNQRRNQ